MGASLNDLDHVRCRALLVGGGLCLRHGDDGGADGLDGYVALVVDGGDSGVAARPRLCAIAVGGEGRYGEGLSELAVTKEGSVPLFVGSCLLLLWSSRSMCAVVSGGDG